MEMDKLLRHGKIFKNQKNTVDDAQMVSLVSESSRSYHVVRSICAIIYIIAHMDSGKITCLKFRTQIAMKAGVHQIGILKCLVDFKGCLVGNFYRGV